MARDRAHRGPRVDADGCLWKKALGWKASAGDDSRDESQLPNSA